MMITPTESCNVGYLPPDAMRVAKIIRTFMRRNCPFPRWDGSTYFYSPAEWRERGELYGLESILIVMHDGGELPRFCDWARQDYPAMERFSKRLTAAKLYVEQCTCWYSAIYHLPRR